MTALCAPDPSNPFYPVLLFEGLPFMLRCLPILHEYSITAVYGASVFFGKVWMRQVNAKPRSALRACLIVFHTASTVVPMKIRIAPPKTVDERDITTNIKTITYGLQGSLQHHRPQFRQLFSHYCKRY